jgi:hypothetical protein
MMEYPLLLRVQEARVGFRVANGYHGGLEVLREAAIRPVNVTNAVQGAQ